MLRSTGAQPLVIGRHAEKLAVARQLGLNAMEGTAGGGRSYDIVVDVSGGTAGLRLGLDLVRPRGTVVLKSTFHGATPVETWPIVVDEVSLVGSRCGPFAPALDLLARGVVQTAPLVAGDYPLSEYRGAFEAAKNLTQGAASYVEGSGGRGQGSAGAGAGVSRGGDRWQ